MPIYLSIDLEQEEAALLLQCLAESERRTRHGFARGLAEKVGKLSPEEIAEKTSRFVAVLARFALLKGKLEQ